MGCRTEPATVHVAHVLRKLHFFQFFNFCYNLHDLPQEKNYTPLPQKKIQFFFIIHTTYRKKKLHAFTAKKNYTHLPQKKITRLDNFFVHDLHFSRSIIITVQQTVMAGAPNRSDSTQIVLGRFCCRKVWRTVDMGRWGSKWSGQA